MFKSSISVVLLALATTMTTTNLSIAMPGYMETTISVSHRSKNLPLHIWFPSDKSNSTKRIGQNPVFVGTEIRDDAKFPKRQLPLVLLSHGSGGNAANLGWLAGFLADSGMIVIAPNHPGTTSRDSDPLQTVKIWQRPQDLSAIIDHLEKHAPKFANIDFDKIVAVGFSLGGHTVLSLAGARAEKTKYIDYCDRYDQQFDCGWLSSGGVDFNDIDQKRFNQSNLDERVKSVISIDPALAAAYAAKSLSEISTPITLINLGEKHTVPEGINISIFSDQIPTAKVNFIQQATHFSFLGLCTEEGENILNQIGEDALCSEVGSRNRSEIHRDLQDLILKSIVSALK